MLETTIRILSAVFLAFSPLTSPSSDYTPPNPMDVIEYQREVKETREARLAKDQANAVDVLHAYLATKYGLSEEDYQLGYYVPLTPETTSYLSINGANEYTGTWQALVLMENEHFYVNVSVRSGVGCDSHQAVAYRSALEEWIRTELQLPENCELVFFIDNRSLYITRANLTVIDHIIYTFIDNEKFPVLDEHYREGDLFSPIAERLDVYINYPEGCAENDYVPEDAIARVFTPEITGDVLVTVRQRAPKVMGAIWPATEF